jgi:transposase-like protein
MTILNKNNVQMRSPKKPIDWTAEQIKDIIISYKNGASMDSLSRLYNVSPQSIAKVLIQNNIPLRTNYQTARTIVFTNEQKEEICQMYNDGYSLSEIATAFNLKSIQAIQRVLEAAKIQRRIDTPRDWNLEEQQKITNLFQEGKSIREIAALLQVSPNLIHKFLVRNDIDVSPRKGDEWWAWLASKDKSVQDGIVAGIIIRQYHLPKNASFENWPTPAKRSYYNIMNKLKNTIPNVKRNIK